jgi:hypothetical protein
MSNKKATKISGFILFCVYQILKLIVYVNSPVVNLFPVNANNFDDMVIKTKPGVRTILLIVNQDTKNKLIQEFARIMEPYSR